jgi:catechol 2,3-dioxygenase-like lactoylglutathione lyase family enzyme
VQYDERQTSMTKSGIRGFWHVALRVKDLARSEAFYRELFGMQVVWRPDATNVYLSSGADNLALHQIPADEQTAMDGHPPQALDHIGLVMESTDSVKQLFQQAQRNGVRIVKPPTEHRDGSYSFYLADPDDTIVQVLYEPTISKLGVRHETLDNL